MSLSFRELVTISRPRFRLYVFWPLLVALAATGFFSDGSVLEWTMSMSRLIWRILVMMLVYFLFPANLFIYWINDLCDYETDQINTKKGTYEYSVQRAQGRSLFQSILLWNSSVVLWLLPLLFVVQKEIFLLILMVLFLFYFTALFYSVKPIRAKWVPFLDGMFNVLYILPALLLYILFVWIDSVQWTYVIAWWLRCIAMHAYSAIPDIEPDKKSGIVTTAVFLGKKWTLWYCAILRILSAFLISWPFPMFAQVTASVYCFFCVVSCYRPVEVVYRYFPIINAWIWFILFRLVVLSYI